MQETEKLWIKEVQKEYSKDWQKRYQKIGDEVDKDGLITVGAG